MEKLYVPEHAGSVRFLALWSHLYPVPGPQCVVITDLSVSMAKRPFWLQFSIHTVSSPFISHDIFTPAGLIKSLHWFSAEIVETKKFKRRRLLLWQSKWCQWWWRYISSLTSNYEKLLGKNINGFNKHLCKNSTVSLSYTYQRSLFHLAPICSQSCTCTWNFRSNFCSHAHIRHYCHYIHLYLRENISLQKQEIKQD